MLICCIASLLYLRWRRQKRVADVPSELLASDEVTNVGAELDTNQVAEMSGEPYRGQELDSANLQELVSAEHRQELLGTQLIGCEMAATEAVPQPVEMAIDDGIAGRHELPGRDIL